MTGTVGSAEEFAAWVRPHLATLHRYAARQVGDSDADDVVQEALSRAWRRRSTYDAARGEPLPWLLAVVRDRARRHRSRRRHDLPFIEGVEPVEPVQPVDMAARDPDLERAVTRLAPRQREVVELYYFVDLDVATIAAALGCAPGTVRATLHHARAALRQLLGDPDE